jgi:hypothetical protein
VHFLPGQSDVHCFAGRQQALVEQRAAEEEAAAEVERGRLRQQDAFSLLVKQAVRSGATAGEIDLATSVCYTALQWRHHGCVT